MKNKKFGFLNLLFASEKNVGLCEHDRPLLLAVKGLMNTE